MNNEERIRLSLEVTGQEGLEESARKTDQLKKSMNDLLLAEMERGDAEVRLRTRKADLDRQEAAASDAAVAQLVEQTRARKFFNEVLEEGTTRQHEVIVSAGTMGETLSTNGAGGRGILQASYAVQDFTSVLAGGGGLARAIGSVQNNIPILLTSLGVGAGLAGTISLVSVAVAAAIPLISSFADKEKEAADATKKWADESDRLQKLQTSSEEKTAKGINEYLKDLPARTVRQGIEAELLSRAQAQGVQAEHEQLAQFGVITESADRFVARNRPRIDADVNRLYGGLSTDPSARAFVADLAIRRPGNFPKNFATDILSFDRDTGDEDLAAAEAFGQRAHAGVESRQKARAETEERRKRVEARQAAEDASIRQAADEHDRATAEADRLAEQMKAESVRLENEKARKEAEAAAKAKHEADQRAREAPLRNAENAIRRTAADNGQALTPQQVTEAAKRALDAVANNIGAQDAALGAIAEVLQKSARMNEHLNRQRAAWNAMRMQFQGLPVQSEPFAGQ